ncbi:hypothetical protein F4780DRAFT_73873 [Xylariomycetidae sp. FL0641]|nr:hypothetical protein F4780DRAFT_73873 [Xylariomycetidae sp. FL0641]
MAVKKKWEKSRNYLPVSIGRDTSPRRYDFRRLSFKRLRPLAKFFVTAAALGCLFLTCRSFQYRRALQTKYSPTRFADDLQWQIAQSPWRHLATDDEPAERAALLGHRDEWTPLSRGYEGEVFVYGDTVIKTFVTEHSPLRNCLAFTDAATKMPTEIPATLLLGGLGGEVTAATDFFPLKDYFLAPATASSPASWHFVTPYLRAGNLDAAAKRQRGAGLTARQLDRRFRPSLHRVLGALGRMHTELGLCHDDVKAGNIFVGGSSSSSSSRNNNSNNNNNTAAEEEEHDDTHWLLADFGNVRQLDHPYHASRLWRRDGRQRPDCRANDVVRLLKTYVQFLRTAAAAGDDTAAFDAAFWARREPWSRLYWATVQPRGPGAARSVRDLSLSLDQDQDEDEDNEPTALSVGGPPCWGFLRCAVGRLLPGAAAANLALETRRELQRGMNLPDRKARLLGAAGLLGIPTTECR